MTDQSDLFDASASLVARTSAGTPPKDNGSSVTPSPAILPFPLARRLGKVRDVANKLLTRTTERAVEHYRRQVTSALQVHLQVKRVPAEDHQGEIARFWLAVDCEVARRLYILRGDERPPVS